MPERYRKTRSLTLSPVVWELAGRVVPLGEIRNRSQLFEEAVLEYLQRRKISTSPHEHSPRRR